LVQRIQSSNAHFAAAGHQDAGQHFNRCAFSGAIWSNQPNNLSSFNREREIVHSHYFAYFRIDNAPYTTQ